MIENMTHWMGLKQGSSLKKAMKDPLYLAAVFTLMIMVIGGSLFNMKTRELVKLEKEEALSRDLLAQKEKSVSLLREDVRKINARLQKKSLASGNLTANERKMSAVLEKMALSAAGKSVEVVAFRPESLTEEEKETLLTVKVKVKTRFNELEQYLSRLGHFPSPVKIDWIKIETLENETPLIYADLLVMTRIMKEKNEK